MNVPSSINDGCTLTIGINTKIGENLTCNRFVSIGNNSIIGNNVTLGFNTYIGSSVYVGDNVVLGDNVKIFDKCKVGANTIIENNCEIGYSRMSKKKEYFEDYPLSIGDNCIIRSGAVIYCACIIGHDSWIGNYTIIRENTKIGNNTTFGSHIMCEGYSTFGNNVKVYSFCELGGNIEVEDYVFIGPSVTTANNPRPVIGAGKLTTHRWNDGKQKVVDKGPTIRFGAKIGIAATLLAEIEIGRNALVAAGAIVTKDVPENSVVRGVPAKQVSEVPEYERNIFTEEIH